MTIILLISCWALCNYIGGYLAGMDFGEAMTMPIGVVFGAWAYHFNWGK